MSDQHLRLVGSAQEELDSTLGDMPVRQVVCRSGHHKFALDDWEPGTPIPRTVVAMHASEGRYKLLDPCQGCEAATRVTYTHPGGGIDGHLESGIVYGKDWHKIPNYLPRGKRVVRQEKYRRGARQLQDLIGRAVTLVGDGDQPPVPQPRFSGA